ncbi:MAG: DNA polymerase I [Ruminococcaceae bacterium]|nr:DNA polymerase I [Oscillospiraceae bacterium]
MKRLLILDSNSILNRAFYGIRFLSAKDGTPTNAIYGLLNILLKLIDEQKPDCICAAFDLSAPTFRHERYAEYKAKRKPMPDELRTQMPLAKELFAHMRIPILEQEGFEADDIIGTVSAICEKEGIECLIATGDKDDLQLASKLTKVILTVTRNGNNETTVYDADAVKERYHVTPTEFIDIKALMGDASDNIPGVAGIGEKTAMSLIEAHHSIEYIYEHIDELGIKGAMLQKLKNGQEMAFLSKELATIERAMPLDFKPLDCSLEGKTISEHAAPELYGFLKKLELNSLIKRLDLKEPADEAVPAIDLFENIPLSMAEDVSELSAWITEIKKAGICALQFSYQGTRLSQIGLATRTKGFGIDCMQFSEDTVLSKLSELFSDASVQKIVFDIKDTLVYLGSSTAICNIVSDVAIAAYLIDPARSRYTIPELAQEYLGASIAPQESGQISLFADDTPQDTVCREAFALFALREYTQKKINENEQTMLYEEIELPLVEILADMQIRGIRIDRAQLLEFGKLLGNRIDEISAQIYDLAGEEFNLNSPKQLGVILFEKLGLKAIKKTKTGYSTNAEVLEQLVGEHPIIELLMEYRQISKLKSTYCDGLAAVIDAKDGRIHSNFTQTVTVTGRLSSTEPNLQNIPVRTALGRELRKMFIADGDEKILIDADYSQIELRVLAHIAQDETMIRAFCENEDIHTVTASQVLGIPPEEVTPEERSSAKAVNFGIVYGIGEFSLSKDLKIPVKQAKQYIQSYLDKYNGVREYMEQIKKQAAEDGYVKTLFHRIRYIPELKASNYNVRSFGERIALNTPIQGTAADIIKLAMVRVYRRLQAEQLKTKLILQIHDELILEAPEEEAELAAKLLKEEMQKTVAFSVPMIADVSVGKSWYEAK